MGSRTATRELSAVVGGDIEDTTLPPRPWIADIGSGSNPWPFANILVDKHMGATEHRHSALRKDRRILICGDLCALPFQDGSLDFVIASHVIEHLDNPLQGLMELQRVSAAGVAWVPTVMGEGAARLLFGSRTSGHKWLTIRDRKKRLVFIPYDESDLDERERILRSLGADGRDVLTGYATELRIAWGWGDYPEKLIAYRMTLTQPEQVEAKGTDAV